jgi:hypothetical protein
MSPDRSTRGTKGSNPGTLNGYTYALNDPVNHNDPGGLDYCLIDGNPIPDMNDTACGEAGGEWVIDEPPPSDPGCNGNGSGFIDNGVDPEPCPTPLQPPPAAAACPGQTSPSGTYYDCIHQSGSDWGQLAKDLQRLFKIIGKDKSCDKLLTSAGATVDTIKSDLGNPSTYFSLAYFILGAKNQTLLATTNDLPGATPIIISSQVINVLGQYQANLTILHELAHLLGVFPAENSPGSPSSIQNDQTIVADCSKSLGKP